MPTMALKANAASTQFSAARCTTRSVTWPEPRCSLMTRTTEAGEVDIDSEASNRAVRLGEPHRRAIA
jgi:hypothetical protein